jgi:hypothetical protein
MNTVIKKYVTIPAGLSGIMSYEHVKTGVYPVQMSSEEYICNVIIGKATSEKLTFALEVSENLLNVCDNFLFQMQALEQCGALGERLIYYKN